MLDRSQVQNIESPSGNSSRSAADSGTGKRPGVGWWGRFARKWWLRRQKSLLQRDGLEPKFDRAWYLARYADVRATKFDPVIHYLHHGAKEGRDPNPFFSTLWYLAQIEADEEATANPLGHYLTQGAARGLSPHPLFDAAYYQQQYPDVAASGMDPLTHFVLHGDKERRSPHPLFNPDFYLGGNPDPVVAEAGPLRHFLTFGGAGGRNPHPMFDCEYYCRLYPEVMAGQGINPLVHYLMQPHRSRRHPHPLFDGAFQRFGTHPQETTIDALMEYASSPFGLDCDRLTHHATGVPTPAPAIVGARRKVCLPMKGQPLVSVLVPAFNSNESLLIATVDSVRAQTWSNWELIIVDDGSSADHMAPLMDALPARDGRIVTTRLPRNSGISEATNAALKLAKGEYITPLDHDDVLMPEAIEKMVQAMLAGDADAAYSDQAFSSLGGAFDAAFHKPDWSPTFFAGVMYVGHLLVVRRELAQAVGGFDKAYDRAQDFEFMLRISERARKIVHVPRILYHWRRVPGSIALHSEAKGKVEPIQARAVNAHFERTSFPATAEPIQSLTHRLSIRPNARTTYPAIDVLVYSLARPASAVADCLATLKQHPARFASVGVLSPKTAVEPASLPAASKSDGVPGILRSPLATALDEALAGTASRYLLCIDPVVQFSKERWLDYLLLYAERPDVAFTAPHLYRRSGKVGAAGLVADAAGLLPAMQDCRLGGDGFAGSLACDREVSALHPGMIMLDRAILQAIGGFDPAFVSPYYLFGDAAVRAVRAGYRNIAIATALATVDDRYPIVPRDASVDVILFRDKHAPAGQVVDPYYSPNFAPGKADSS